jgi:ribosome-binding protein aMBF1 (putative translation factor)
MAKLSDVRRRFPPDDADAYAAAYTEAELAENLALLVQGLRLSAGLSEAELAARMGVGEAEIQRAEEGDASVSVVFLHRLGRAVGVRLTMTSGDVQVVLGVPGISTPPGA